MIRKFTLLLLAMLCIAGTSKADPVTTWSNWSGSQKITWTGSGEGEVSSILLLDKTNTAIAIGDVITVTFTATSAESDSKVTLRAYNTDIVAQDDAKGTSPSTAIFRISARERDVFCRYGLKLGGNNITVTAINKVNTFTGSNNSVWVGSENWCNVSSDAIKDVKAGDRIVVNMSKTGSNTDFAFGYVNNYWLAVPFDASSYTKSDTKAELKVTADLAATMRANNGIYVNGSGNYTTSSIDLITEDQTATQTYAPDGGLTFGADTNFEIPTEYLKGRSAGDKMFINVTSISGSGSHRLSLAENNWDWIGWISDKISSTGEIEFTITDQMITANKSLPLHISGSNCVVDKITFKPTTVNVTIGADKYATYSCEQALDFSGTSVKAYYASAVASGEVTFTEIEQVPANTGILVYCETADTYQIPVIASASLAATNYLKPNSVSSSIAASVEGTYHYIFAKDNTTSEIGFYKLEADHTLAAHKAYLETTTPPTLSMSSRSYMRLSFGGGEGTTAINTALKNPIVEDGLYYTLQGVAVKNPSKGIYILNGKKVFVK